MTKEGIPVRCFVYPGNASDQEIIREVKDMLREWRLHRVIWVRDTGFNSEENRSYLQCAGGHYIIGEKLRQGTANRSALARQGRYRKVDDTLQVKQVWVGEGETRRRFVVCRNLEEARRDKYRRERLLERIHLGYFHGTAGRVHQRTELTLRQREILAAIDVPEPPRFLAITLTPSDRA